MKKIKLTIRALTVALVFLVLFSFGELTVNAKGYSYDFWKNVIPCTDGFFKLFPILNCIFCKKLLFM